MMTSKLSVFLSYAFRPFFLLNGIFAVIVMTIWIGAFYGMSPPGLPINIAYWHAHEMTVGFILPSIAGFALTAVATWTGRAPVGGWQLALLVLAWLAGRIIMAFANLLPATLVASVDMLFPLLLVFFVGREIYGGGSRRNYPIVGIIAAIALLNSFYHLAALGVVSVNFGIDRVALYLLIHLSLLLITVIGGRIVPSFTTNWLRSQGKAGQPVSHPSIEVACLFATLCTGIFAALAPLSLVTGWLATIAMLAHLTRVALWRGELTLSEPLLFVLHVAYLWLPIGYGLTAASVFGWLVPPEAALHALTVGAVSLMIMAVTTRVSLGHTGRPLQAGRLTVFAYWLLILAAIFRVLGPGSTHYLATIALAGACWIAAFAIFIWVYWPVLTGPKLSDQPSA